MSATVRQRIGSVTPRATARVAGRVVSVQVEPLDAPPAFTVRVDDGTGRLDAVFMGRREIPGIIPGSTVELEGCVCDTDALPRVYNPRYTLGVTAVGARESADDRATAMGGRP